MEVPRSPQALSVPLYEIIQEADTAPNLKDVLGKLQDGIKDLKIEKHVSPVLSFDEDREIVNVEPRDSFGAAICVELKERIAFPPCPDDMCEPVPSLLSGTTACRWCGKNISLN